jgi:hypothetical protein
MIPGELRLSNPVPPPVTVPLPIVAWPHGPKNFWLGLLGLLSGLLLFPSGLLLAFGLMMAALGSLNYQAPLGYYLFVLALCPFLLWYGLSFLGLALTCFWDASRSGPVLEITADGLRDYRSGLAMPWSSVRSARFLAFSVDLQLHAPVPNWQNPFRVGVVFQRCRPIPDRIIVSAGYLDVPAHVVMYVILTLVKWNGGEVITKVGNAEIQRLLPRAGASRLGVTPPNASLKSYRLH